MPDRIFISYSHKDQKYFDAFHKHLRVALGGDERLEIWTDTRIRASADWHREIQTALEECKVAVLLVSVDFLDSKYIRDQELPVLLGRRLQEKLILTSLFVRPSIVDEREFSIQIPGQDEIRRVRITQFQGFNSPKDPLSQMRESDRELALLHAARTVRDLARSAGVSPASRDRDGRDQRRFELLIDLERRGRDLIRTFSLPDWDRFTVLEEDPKESPEKLKQWNDSGYPLPPQALFELLFGTDGDRASRILLDAFEIPHDGALPNPTAHPLRLRLRTADPILRGLPWTQIQWDGQLLRDHGWTVELAPTGDSGFPDFKSVLLRLPAPVLLVLPGLIREEPDAGAHRLGLLDCFQRLWPLQARPPAVATNTGEVIENLAREAPRILYYYGSAAVKGDSCRLFPDEKDSGGLTLEELAGLLEDTGTSVVFLNLVGDQALGAGAQAAPIVERVPFVGVQICPRRDTLAARETFFHWLEAISRHSDPADPVWALHRYGLSTACAWGGYGHWRTQVSDRQPETRLAQLVLDRHRQRERIAALLDDLVRDPALGVCHLLAYGSPGNHAEEFPNQVVKHLRRRPGKSAHIHRRDVCLPTSATSEQDIDYAFRRDLDIGVRDSAAAALQIQAKTRDATPYVPLLIWTLDGYADLTRLRELLTNLGRWVLEHLVRDRPRGLKLLSLLTLELAEKDLDTVAAIASSLLDRPDLIDEAFELETLVPLDQVDPDDIKHFIRRESNCPPKLKNQLPELVYRETQGHFDKAVRLLDRGQSTSWYDLYERLTRTAPLDFPVNNLAPRPGGLSLRREDMYADDGR